MSEYKGYETVEFSDEELAKFYQEEYFPIEPCLNQYYIISNNGKIIDKVKYVMNNFVPLKYHKINSDYLGELKSRNIQQDFALDMLQDNSIAIKILAGRYGTGKTLLMIAQALEFLEKHQFDKIVFVRNNIELRDTTPLGALPGSLTDKVIEWAANLGDHLGGMDAVKDMIERGKLEIAPLGYMRGRDFKRCIILCDEAENLTTHQCQLLIGRIGEGSQLWLAGDRRQTDKNVFDKDSGMKKMIDKLRGQRLFGYVCLEKSERSEASALADLLDD